jgi:tRNA pseudouridine55 synthase
VLCQPAACKPVAKDKLPETSGQQQEKSQVTRNQRSGNSARRDIDGIIVIDKPPGMSSASVVAGVKKIIGAKKVGHAGTLDPFAEGVLICCINHGTRLAEFLLHGTKKYAAQLKLGQETDTQDLTGAVISTTKEVDFPRQTIETAFETFKGTIEQIPPVYSALKHKGVPLYKLARRGQPVQKPPRQVEIFDIWVREVNLPHIRFEVACSAGTYIRTLASDIGKKLGCGGHLSALKRVASSGFSLDQAVSLAVLKKLAASRELSKCIISMRDALPGIPEFEVGDQLAHSIRHGQQLTAGDLASANGDDSVSNDCQYLKIVDRNKQLIAIVERETTGDRLKYSCVFPKSGA